MIVHKVFVSEDIDSNNLGVTTTLLQLGYTDIGHAQYCDEAFLKLKNIFRDFLPKCCVYIAKLLLILNFLVTYFSRNRLVGFKIKAAAPLTSRGSVFEGRLSGSEI